MPPTKVKASLKKRSDAENLYFDVTLKNGSGKIAFFNEVLLLGDDGLPVHLYALGTGPDQRQIEAYLAENGLSDYYTFLGYQTNPYKYVAKCDLFVCASHAEGFSTAATEALIVGTPVCTVEVSGMKEMLGAHNEWGVVTENDDEALYQGIKRLVSDPALLSHYREKAKERGKTFSTENTVKAVEALFEKDH